MIGGISLQPSEFLKIALVLGLARYFHGVPSDKISNPLFLHRPRPDDPVVPLIPIFMQPDLGTAVSGRPDWHRDRLSGGSQQRSISSPRPSPLSPPCPYCGGICCPISANASSPFFDPERDPLGAGYHLLQSKIALGSADMWGKGSMKGSQSQLNFLPEKHTDFIFAMFTEERGFLGAMGLMGLYMLSFGLLSIMALRTKNLYGRLLIAGMALTLFLYVVINMGMVMGMLPVVGVPLPLMSYGGTSILSIMFGLGVAISAYVHR